MHYLIIGPVTHEGYAKDLESYMAQHDPQHRITIVPGLPPGGKALADAYHAANAFVLPSVHEPFGIVILEAWSAGLPVIASRVGGIPSFVVSGQDGLLFDSNNDRSFLGAVEFLVHNPDQAKAWAEAGNRKARTEYDWNVVMERLVALYEEAIRENPLRQ